MVSIVGGGCGGALRGVGKEQRDTGRRGAKTIASRPDKTVQRDLKDKPSEGEELRGRGQLKKKSLNKEEPRFCTRSNKKIRIQGDRTYLRPRSMIREKKEGGRGVFLAREGEETRQVKLQSIREKRQRKKERNRTKHLSGREGSTHYNWTLNESEVGDGEGLRDEASVVLLHGSHKKKRQSLHLTPLPMNDHSMIQLRGQTQSARPDFRGAPARHLTLGKTRG